MGGGGVYKQTVYVQLRENEPKKKKLQITVGEIP